MRKKFRSKKTIIISLLVILCLVATCVVVSITASADTTADYNFGSALPVGETKYFSAVCTTSGNDTETVYLRVEKGVYDNLYIYTADKAKGLFSSTTMINSLSGTYSDSFGNETWSITVDGEDYTAISDLRQLSPEEWGGAFVCTFSSELDNGETRFYMVKLKDTDNATVTKYLKAVKNPFNSLAIYEANSPAGALGVSGATSTGFTGSWDFSYNNQEETWTIYLGCDTGRDYEGYAIAYYEEINAVYEVSNLPTDTGLPVNAVSYCKVGVMSSVNVIEYKYLKLQKDAGRLIVFSSDTLEEFGAAEDVDFAAVPLVTGEAAPYTESWLLALSPDSEYTRFITVSPLTTSITAVKKWNSSNTGDYINVADDTVVRFELAVNGTAGSEIWVKKAENSLKVSSDGNNAPYFDSLIYGDKTVSAMLVPANGASSQEEWVITFTGYDRENTDGSIIEYKVTEKDIISVQHWIPGETTMIGTFDGLEQYQAGDIYYTLKLKTAEGKEYDIARITKSLEPGGKLTDIHVQGLTGRLDSSGNDYTFATATEARCGNKVADASGAESKIDINNNTVIKVSDIASSPEGVTVFFRAGVDNGVFSVTIKITESGKLSYEFRNLPADIYMVDPNSEISSLNVASYRVETRKSNNNW